MKIHFLGTSAGGPFGDRWASAAIVEVGHQPFLIDCGEGCQMRMAQFGIKKSRIRQIFITHLHGDHVFGLPGLLGSMALAGRREPLDIFSPPGLGAMMEAIFEATAAHGGFEIRFIETPADASRRIFENEVVEVRTIPLRHRVACSGYLFSEKEKPRTMRTDKIIEYGIPFSDIKDIKNGADFRRKDGFLVKNVELTDAPPAPKKLAFCSDTAFSDRIAGVVRAVDLLVHEATFMTEKADHATMTGHSTAAQAAEIAERAGAKKLVLTHFSSRYTDLEPLLNEAKAVFENTFLAADGAVFEM